MARIRTIKPEFWSDYRLATELSRDERLFYIALWNEADDEGRFQAHPRRLLGVCFPYDEDVTAANVESWLQHLAATGRLTLYEADSEPYGQLTKFGPHQHINRPTPSRLPAPDTEFGPDSRSPHGAVTESSSPRARAPDLEQGSGKGSGTGNPPGVAPAREPVDPEPLDLDQDEPLPEVPADRGAKVVPLRPPVAAPDALPFGGLDWEGRTSGSVVLREWINLQPAPPGRSDRDRFGSTCKRLADEHTTGEIALAFLGMGSLWPHAPPKSEPWTPEHLRKRFVEALAAAANHPTLARMREDAAFDEAFEHATNGRKR